IGPQIRRFVESEKPVLGVCNGFQILVELGLLPALDDVMSPEPTAALYTNDSARFECRPTLLRNDNRGKCIFASEIPKKKVLMIPSAHAEGKLLSMDPRFVDRLEENDQIVFRYVGENGEDAEYPWNPNGSPSDIAGICNPAGNVLGMMPHPERVLTRFTHPDWTRGYDSEEGDGLCLFRSVMKKLI
ncbi:MAG: phosphoribosylformylglycinamidine synthase subunit PurQ, partial [Methanomassiliicoccales archaeon]|nr:phosphoribosylformylglycinamidine synthase subunit PurQ [Methanomassiliicoccales archaeon]